MGVDCLIILLGKPTCGKPLLHALLPSEQGFELHLVPEMMVEPPRPARARMAVSWRPAS